MRRSHCSILLSVPAILVLVGGLSAPALHTSAATPVPAKMASIPGAQVITYYAGPVENPAHIPPPDVFLQRAKGVGAQTATITVNYNGTWDTNAQTAFEYAVTIWEALITSPIDIVVDASWEPLGPGVLGSAGAASYYRDFPNAPVAGTWYPTALANKLAGSDQDSPPAVEIEARFSSAFSSWYLGTDGNTPGGQVDFVSVVLHELGHGLGFAGSMRVGGSCGPGDGCWGSGTGYPFIYDRYAVNGSGQLLITIFTNDSPELASQLTSGNIYFNGPSAVKANGNSNVKLYAPGTWAQGSSYSHLDEVFNNTPHALMTYSIGSGESIHNPGSVTLCMFKDMGWTVTVSGASAGANAELAPGFAAFGADSVTVMLTSTIYLPVVTNSYSGVC